MKRADNKVDSFRMFTKNHSKFAHQNPYIIWLT